MSDSLGEIEESLARALLGSTCHRVVLSRRRGNRDEFPERIVIRPVGLASGDHYQFTSESEDRQTHENLSPAAAVVRVDELFPGVFRDVHLFTASEDLSARVGRAERLKVHRGPASTQPPETPDHDRRKQYLLPEGEPCRFLEAIGVMTAAGRVRRSRTAKFRQVNRFLELVDDCLDALPEDRRITVLDFGSGKSYLTFALHHLLTVLRHRTVRIVGLDRNPDVVADCRGIAERLGLDDIEFRLGDIAGFEYAEPVDLAVSLHACDTATDDALARAVAWEAEVILAVPCCQHELSAALEIDRLAAVQRHGILQERLAALVTDALRAEALEVCGYRAQVVEFIDLEHTAKNVLLRAVRRDGTENGSRQRQRHVDAYRALRENLAVETTRLEEQLGELFRELVARD
ncbi:MAG: SAM-dependent methyltransferase [Planctomycetaceae bacterium]|nr:SAM-dependent methyltransferase [Planctomycetaceae bacterium]MDP7275182.1 SAM-dependent methyltransferase [Planctomycetaceae bacterium]